MRFPRTAISVTLLFLALFLPPLALARQRAAFPIASTGQPVTLPRKPLRFRGELVYVSPTALEVLESNGLVIGALLPANHPEHGAAQLPQHAVGDQVELTAAPIAEFYDTGTQRSYSLEFDSIQYLGRPKASQLQAAMDSLARLEPGNRLAPPPGAAPSVPQPQPNALPVATQAAMRHWITSFPDYLADASEQYDEILANARVPTARRRLLTYTATVTDGKIARSNLTMNGAPWPDSYLEAPVYHWDGGFGYMDAFVRPECRLRITAGASADTSFAEPVDGFSFTGPANGCLGDLYIGYETVFAPVHGKLWIASADRLPRRLEMTYDFPSAFTLRSMQLDIDWALVTVVAGHFVLPSTASIQMEQEGGSRHSVVTYTNYHQFTASASVKFLGVPQAAAPLTPNFAGLWKAAQFSLDIARDAAGTLTATYTDGSSSQPAQLELNGNAVSLTVAGADGQSLTFRGTLNPAATEMDGTLTTGDQSHAVALKRQHPSDQ